MTREELDDLLEIVREIADEEAHGAGLKDRGGLTYLDRLIFQFKSTWCD